MTRTDPIFGCHIWTGRKDKWGYPRTDTGELAHRAAYRMLHGDPGADMEIDHVCRRRLCVNPKHLEAVTRAENGKRKRLGYRLTIKLCPMGHELTKAARALTPEGGIACRECR